MSAGTDWRDALERERREKEEYFRDHPRSPLPPSMRGGDFPGLEYFPIDPKYRFELPLIEHGDPEEITVETTADGEQRYLEYGEFRFEIDGDEYSLQAYRPVDGGDRFWVPFRDATSGESTYGAGRYLDLEPDEHRTAEGTWVVDFNAAYNPTCAYNTAYECPLVPTANWLDVAIEAGEKDFPAEPAEPDHHGHGHGHGHGR